ncbi:hypothetical protein [Chryseobacterium viscerum]|uniref:Lipoprotein n=1 Tax=Chryseobacterium viscerum TaxID=1037377 RepID=A0A5N4BVT1_9FLAO|nr:hypothetical protein [Chryseobacterium viscerum]KAB1232558.1 hypothetical protein F8D52_02005 [Chryseobacterium viscerum]
MIVKKQILNKIFILLFLTLLLCSCSAQKINVNHIVDTYINYNSSKDKMFNPTKTYLLMGLFSENENSQNKVLSLSYNCFECNGNVTDKETVVQYKGYKVIVITDNIENKALLFKYFKNTTKSETFNTIPFNKNIIYDPPAHLGIRFDNKGKIYFICMGGKTKKNEKNLRFK